MNSSKVVGDDLVEMAEKGFMPIRPFAQAVPAALTAIEHFGEPVILTNNGVEVVTLTPLTASEYLERRLSRDPALQEAIYGPQAISSHARSAEEFLERLREIPKCADDIGDIRVISVRQLSQERSKALNALVESGRPFLITRYNKSVVLATRATPYDVTFRHILADPTLREDLIRYPHEGRSASEFLDEQGVK